MKSNETWTWNHKNGTNGNEFGITFNNGSVTFEINSGEITFTKPKDIEDMAEFLTRVATEMRSILLDDSQN